MIRTLAVVWIHVKSLADTSLTHQGGLNWNELRMVRFYSRRRKRFRRVQRGCSTHIIDAAQDRQTDCIYLRRCGQVTRYSVLAGCPWRGPGFGSQHPHCRTSLLWATPVPGGQIPSSGLRGDYTLMMQTWIQAKHHPYRRKMFERREPSLLGNTKVTDPGVTVCAYLPA